MALYQFLCGVAVMILLSANGCDSNKPVCGKIHQGSKDWPWRVNISTISGSCLGTLISHEWVLTDIYCEPSLNGTVHLGQSHGNAYEDSRTVAYVTCHSAFLPWDGLCLLQLSAPVNFTNTLGPVCLSSTGFFHTGTEAYVDAGYGETEDVKTVGYNQCKCHLNQLQNDEICAGKGFNYWWNGCGSNVGGALVTKKNDTFVQTGVVQHDNHCPDPESLQSYTDVSYYKKWIINVTHNQASFVDFYLMGHDSDKYFVCPTFPPTGRPMPTPHDCTDGNDGRDDSIFDSGVTVMHSSFMLLCVLVLSFSCTG
uniref:chymotrypsin-like protease CTRL-1 n=1 Tax=Semicossyphus pulcher TaxID=241346 RepID=UPI0037E9C904